MTMIIFVEVDAEGEPVRRTVYPRSDSITELDPIVAWSGTPLPSNTCETAIEISEDGDFIKGTGNQWYTYTASEDVQLTLSVEDYQVYYGVSIYQECGEDRLAYADRWDGDLLYNLNQGETILIKWDNYYSEDISKSYEWTLETRVTKTFNC